MKALAAIALLAGLVAPALAQTADHPSCAPWKAKWAEASKGADLAAIDAVIGKILALCPNLRAEATAGRASAANRIEQEGAARVAAARAADPCLQARNDWASVQSASAAIVQDYRKGLPSVCTVQRRQADERVAALESQRVAAEKQAEGQRLDAAAKSLGIEGRWSPLDCNPASQYGMRIAVSGGDLVITLERGLKPTYRRRIVNIERGTILYEGDPADPDVMPAGSFAMKSGSADWNSGSASTILPLTRC